MREPAPTNGWVLVGPTQGVAYAGPNHSARHVGRGVASGCPNVQTDPAIPAGTFGYRSSASLGDMGLPLEDAGTKAT
jgi:hypothetical protein